MGVVPLRRLIFNMRRGNGDAAGFLFRRRVNLVVGFEFPTKLGGHYPRDRRRQRGLTMVNMANRPYIDMRLAALKLFFGHRTVTPSDSISSATASGCLLDNCLRNVSGGFVIFSKFHGIGRATLSS